MRPLAGFWPSTSRGRTCDGSWRKPICSTPRLWQQGAELGWTAMLVPEEHGGGSVTEQPMVDLVALAEELGRELNPGPFVPTNVVAAAIARFGSQAQQATYLPGLARGEATAAWCLSGDGSPEPAAVAVHADPRGRRLATRRCLPVRARGDQASLLLVVARQPDGLVNLLVPRMPPDSVYGALSGLDLTRRFSELTFDGVIVPEGNELSDDRLLPRPHKGWSVMTACLNVATILQAGESVGAAEVLFEETVEYLKRREQFGRTIASFQAIKHRLADLQIELEAMRVAAEYAALAYGDEFEDADLAVDTAGSLCGRRLRPSGRRSAAAARWDRIHLGARRAPLRAPGQGQPGALRRRGVASRSAAVRDRVRIARRKPEREADGRDRRRAIPGSYDDYRSALARLPGRAQAHAAVETAHRCSCARPGQRRGEVALVRPDGVRRRLRAGSLPDRARRPVRTAHPRAGAGAGWCARRSGQPVGGRRVQAFRD